MLLLQTPRIRRALELALGSDAVEESDKLRVLEAIEGDGIDHVLLRTVVEAQGLDFAQACAGSRLVFPPRQRPQVEKTPEYDAARRRAEELAYFGMVQNILPDADGAEGMWTASSTPKDAVPHEIRQANRQLTAILNALYTIVALAGGTFYASSHFSRDLGMVTLRD